MHSLAAGLERSPQQIDALFEKGIYADIGYTFISPDVQGVDSKGNHIGNLAEEYQSLSFAVKTDLSPDLRLAIIYDEPFGAKVRFNGVNSFVSTDHEAADAQTAVQVKSKNITALLGHNIHKNFMIYAGPVLQQVEANVKLRGESYALNSGYNNSFDDIALGWVAGMNYSQPEKGILASLTYRSDIKHKANIYEDSPIADIALQGNYDHMNSGEITLPESINLNFQMGINSTTGIFTKLRYVPWSDFAYYPPVLKEATTAALGHGLPLVNFSKDQTAIELGVSKRVAANMGIAVSALWDSGAGDPAPTLGPVNGYWGVGLAGKYNFNPKVALAVGTRYMWFGDAQGSVSDGRIVGEFGDNHGYIIGMKLSYQSH